MPCEYSLVGLFSYNSHATSYQHRISETPRSPSRSRTQRTTAGERIATAMGTAYVYYSYEQWGRGYIGARNRSPIDDPYLGTYSDTTFAPTEKIVLAEFDTFEEALEAEVALHAFFDVAANPHFANRARQTSSGFMYDPTGREVSAETREKLRAGWTDERRAAVGDRLAEYNRSEQHSKVVAKRNRKYKLWGNQHTLGYTHTDEAKEKISKAQKGRPKSASHGENLRKTATGRRSISNGQRRSWLYPGQPMPEGWHYGTK